MQDRPQGDATADRLLSRWRHFARDVEAGYRLGMYDYMNDLSVRGMIEDLIRKSTTDARVVAVRVSKGDDLFRAATTATAKPLFGHRAPADEWWWYRRLNRLVGELADDFEQESAS